MINKITILKSSNRALFWPFVHLFSLIIFSYLSVAPVRAISITTVAANAASGIVEGVQAISRLTSPYGVYVDADHNIYSINHGHNIAKINAEASLSYIAGGSTAAHLDATGQAARFNLPYAGAVYQGNLYIADSGNHCIRKVNLTTMAVTTVAGTPSSSGYVDGSAATAKFNQPQGLVIDSLGNIFVSDATNRRIRKIDTSGNVSTYAGTGANGFLDGPAMSAIFRRPMGMAINANNDLFVADRDNGRIRKIYVKNGVLTVETIAGTGVSGDQVGLPITSQLNTPQDVALDALGNIYIADTGNNKIKKIDINTGNLVLVAGVSGGAGYADGDETTARFNTPTDIFISSNTVLYIADNQNHCIRKIDLNGTYEEPGVKTIAGRNSAGNTDGVFGLSRFNKPSGMAMDSLGNIYIADANNNRIRKLDPAGNLTTFAGSSAGYLDGLGLAAQFNSPADIVVDSNDNLFVADYNNHRIRKIDQAGNVTTYAGDGVRASDNGAFATASFNFPKGLAIDAADNIYVADYTNNMIRLLDAANSTVSTLAGTGTAGLVDGTGANVRMRNPADLSIDSQGNIYVADFANNAIRKLRYQGAEWVMTTVAGGIGAGYLDGKLYDAMFNSPTSVQVDADDNLYVSDRLNNRIRKIDFAAGEVTTIAGTGLAGFLDGARNEASFNTPDQMFLAGDSLYLSDYNNDRIRLIDLSSSLAGSDDAGSNSPSYEVYTISGLLGTAGYLDGGPAISKFNLPYGMAMDVSGNVYIADRNNNRIRKIDVNGVATNFAGTGTAGALDGNLVTAQFNTPSDIAIDASGNLYVADYGNHKIRKISTSGTVTTYAGDGVAGALEGPALSAEFRNPIAVEIDASGGLYVSDYNNHKIRYINSGGTVSTFAGTGTSGFVEGDAITTARFNRPVGLALSSAGDLYISDSTNNRIRKVSSGIVSTFAGAGTAGFADGKGTQALFSSPWFMDIDASGNLYLSDSVNNRIRKISPYGRVSTFAGTGLPGYADGELDESSFNVPRGILVSPDEDIYVTEDSHRVRRITKDEIIVPPPPPPSPPPQPTFNHSPIIKLVNDINFDASQSFMVREGANLELKVFVYDMEDGYSVVDTTTWISSLAGEIGKGIRFSTASLVPGIHHITVRTQDRGGEVGDIHFTIEIIPADADLGDGEGGGADRNGDGVIDENDREVVVLAVKDTIVQILDMKKLKFAKTAKAKFKAVAARLNGQNEIEENISSRIIWEMASPSSDTEPAELREFLAEGPYLNLNALPKGTYTVYARVDESETSINITVAKKLVIINK